MSNPASLVPFKKGKDPRRNVTGANKGSRSLTTLLREALEVIGEGNKDPYAVLLVKKVMKMAIVDGNEQMIKLCYNYLEGMPKQEIASESNVTLTGFENLNEQQLDTIINQLKGKIGNFLLRHSFKIVIAEL